MVRKCALLRRAAGTRPATNNRRQRMGRSRLGWVGSAAAPWCVALFFLLSITAEAEQEPTQTKSAFDPVRAAIAFSRQPPREAVSDVSLQSWPREVQGPRDDEFDPGHSMGAFQLVDGGRSASLP